MRLNLSRIIVVVGGCLIAALLIFAAFAPNVVFAADGKPNVVGPPVQSGPSTGTLVASVLETAGYVSQAKILSQLKTMLSRVGALIYLCCIIVALVSVATTGRHDLSLWLLIGPALFFFLINPNPNSTAAGTNWQFGAFKDPRSVHDKLMGSAGVQLAEGDRVSWFFHGFNVLVSDTVQQLIELFTDQNLEDQMKFMARQQILDKMQASQVIAPGLQELARIVQTQCSRAMNAARLVALGQRDPSFKTTQEYQQAVKDYCDEYVTKFDRAYLDESPARNFALAEVLKQEDHEAGDENFENRSCFDLWEIMARGIQEQAKDALATAEEQRIPPDASAELHAQILNDIKEKITQATEDGTYDQVDFTCPAAGGNVTPPPTDGREIIQLVFTGYMIRKLFSDDPRGKQVAQFAEHAGVAIQPMTHIPFESREGAYEMVRRFRLDRLAETTRYEAYTLAMTLPYVQGIGLYVLATLFPFFAMMVIVPGQAGSFFGWCALWVWFKSWDAGWALVMAADELLWVMMPHSSYFRLGSKGGAGSFADPVTVFEAAFDGDYSYNLTTYYMLLAAMLSAVPVISANAVLGSKKAIAGITIDGLKSLGSTLSAHVGDYMSPGQLDFIDRNKEYAAAQQVMSKLIPMHVQMSMIDKRFGLGGEVERAALATQTFLNDHDLDTRINQMTDAFLGSAVMSNFKHFRHDPKKREEVRQAIAAQIGRAQDFSVQNRFARLMQAQVKGADGKPTELGAVGALEEVFRQANFDLASANRILTVVGMPEYTQADIDRVMGMKGPEFIHEKDRLELGNPMSIDYGLNVDGTENGTRILNSSGSENLDARMARQSIEAARATADNLTGLAEYLAIRGAGALFIPGAPGKLMFTTAQDYANAFGEAGLVFDRMASKQSADFLEKAASHYYFQTGQSSEWLFWEQARAGISLREEWWNTPDAPVDVQGQWFMQSHKIQEATGSYLGKLGVDTLTTTKAVVTGGN
ncbi:MAG: hypothetical protein U0136_12095 [Bdellovibrionota bacterium]